MPLPLLLPESALSISCSVSDLLTRLIPKLKPEYKLAGSITPKRHLQYAALIFSEAKRLALLVVLDEAVYELDWADGESRLTLHVKFYFLGYLQDGRFSL